MQTNKGHVGTASAHLTLGCPAWPLFVNASAPNKTAPFRQVAVRDSALTTRGSLLSPWWAVEPLTFSMRTSGLGRSIPMAALASEEIRRPSRWARWRVEAVAEATADKLRTARTLSPRQ